MVTENTLFVNFIELFLDSAPWLLLGLVLAGMLKMFVPMEWMHKQLGGHGIKTTVKAAVLGAPLPLCSCGVIPAAVGLRRAGASKAATTSFLVSTPETGVDSVSVSYVLLGPFMAIVRPIAAVSSAIVAGLLVGRDDNDSGISKSDNAAEQATSSCCASKKSPAPVSEPAVEKTSCCSSKPVEQEPQAAEKTSCCSSKSAPTVTAEPQAEQKPSIARKLSGGLQYAATDLVRDTTIWLLIGLFFAAIVQTYVPADFMAKWGDGILAMLVMVLISIPMYICATASTPIAAGLLLAGVSPGAVLVFMLAGPATNIATLGVVTKELGKRALFGYLGGVLGVALISGVVVNYLVATYGFVVMPQIGEHHQLLPSAVVYISGVILAVLMLRVLIKKLSAISFKPAKKGCCS